MGQFVAILIAGIGGLSIQIPYALNCHVVDKVITITSVSTALFLGIATYAICNFVEKRFGGKDAEEPAPEVAENPAENAEDNK